MNPLFPSDHDTGSDPRKDTGYVLRRPHSAHLQPVARADGTPDGGSVQPEKKTEKNNAAVELIRRKLDAIFAEEPNAKQEIAEVEATPAKHRTKHQEFMHRLTTSGKPLAQIQTEWHAYYSALPDDQKHKVWQEFYDANTRHPSTYTHYVQQHLEPQAPKPVVWDESRAVSPEHHNSHAVTPQHAVPPPPRLPERRTSAEIKKQVVGRVRISTTKKQKAKQHLHSLLFGLSTGAVVILILLFGLFNEMVIAPFIQPSRHVSATPIILNADAPAPSDTPEVIVPKLNVQIPVVYDEKDISEAAVQRALERGVIHYPTTVLPGQQGNAAFFGHSSNNIFNKGKYKFAFVLLHELSPGDIFYLTYEKKVYSYRVFDKKIVTPDQISVLGNIPGKTATAALITCDPPGTSTNRLVVWGEQITPDPTGATEPTAPTIESEPQALPSEGPTMWKRFTNWVF